MKLKTELFNQEFWEDKKVIVTGGAGFLGSHLVDGLKQLNAKPFVPRSKDCDLRILEQPKKYFSEIKPDIVIHCAAFYGGIWINKLYPGKIYYENLIMGANTIEAARLADVDKFVGIGTACSYPGDVTDYMKEEDLWNGLPHESVRNYGTTKKMMALQGWAYKKQYDFNSIHLILTNLYGPRDTFNFERAHVVSALIRRFYESKLNNENKVAVWGTGKPQREFLYVEDCAEGILLATEKYNNLNPLNLGTGIPTSIKELATTILEQMNYDAEIEWDISKPDGQFRKVLDVSRMKEELNWEPRTNLKEGLNKTIEWYKANKKKADEKY